MEGICREEKALLCGTDRGGVEAGGAEVELLTWFDTDLDDTSCCLSIGKNRAAGYRVWSAVACGNTFLLAISS